MYYITPFTSLFLKHILQKYKVQKKIYFSGKERHIHLLYRRETMRSRQYEVFRDEGTTALPGDVSI